MKRNSHIHVNFFMAAMLALSGSWAYGINCNPDGHPICVESVEWDGVKASDGKTNLTADNPGSHGGGFRIFPGKNKPGLTEPLHNK